MDHCVAEVIQTVKLDCYGLIDDPDRLGSLAEIPLTDVVRDHAAVYQVVCVFSRPSSNKALKVDPRGFEPLTFWLPARRSTS
jgi:hypothetical protein